MKIVLRPLKLKDVNGMLEWICDEETQQWFQTPMEKKTEKDIINFIKAANIEPEDGKSIHLAVVDEKDEYLGTVSLKNYSERDQNAEFAISLRSYVRGKGIGREATKKLLQLAFDKWKMKRVYLNVLSDNAQAIRLYERCGFVYEGEFLQHLYIHGKYQNLRWYRMIKEEYDKIKLGGGKKQVRIYDYHTFFCILLSAN